MDYFIMVIIGGVYVIASVFLWEIASKWAEYAKEEKKRRGK